MTQNVAVIGAGRIGRLHIGNLLDLDASVVVVEPNRERANDAARDFGVPIVEWSSHTVRQADAAVVATGTAHHVAALERLYALGVTRIFVEKPVALAATYVRKLDEARPPGTRVMVGFQRRFDSAYTRLIDDVRSGAVGTVEHIDLRSRDRTPPPSGFDAGSEFHDISIHDIDTALQLFRPTRVWAWVGGETTGVLLTDEDGRSCSIVSARHSTVGYDHTAAVWGSTGELFHSDPSRSTYNDFADRYRDAYRNEMIALLYGSTRDLTGATLDDAHAAVVIADAASRSERSGREVKL